MSAEPREERQPKADSEEFSAGTLPVISDVEIEALLGQGNLSLVYKGHQRLLDRSCAVKILPTSKLPQGSALARFKQEAKLASSLDHPNIVKILSFDFSSTGDPYLVMEFAPGLTLTELMEQAEYGSLRRLAEIFLPILAALSYAHDKKIVHRDIKPSNIIVNKNNDGTFIPKLVDFGLAKVFTEPVEGQHSTTTGVLLGTPNYMSPEQCAGSEIDGRADIYSLACVMYQFLSGEPIFSANSSMELMDMHLHKAPPTVPLFCKKSGIRADLAKTIISALQKDPLQRPQTASEFSEKLSEALNNSDEQPLSRRKQEISRQKMLQTLTILLVLIPSVSFVAMQNRKDKTPNKASEAFDKSTSLKSINSTLSEIKPLYEGTLTTQAEALDRYLEIVPRLEAKGNLYRTQLTFVYSAICTLANTFSRETERTIYTKAELTKMVLDYANRGLVLAEETNNPTNYSRFCMDSSEVLSNQENGSAIIMKRIKTALRRWPKENNALEISRDAFFTFLRSSNLSAAKEVVALVSQSMAEHPKQSNLWSLWKFGMQAHVAINSGKKEEACKYLEPVMAELNADSSFIELDERQYLFEQVIEAILSSAGKEKQFIEFAEKDYKKNYNAYLADGESRLAHFCDMLSHSYYRMKDTKKYIYFLEKSMELYKSDPGTTAQLERRYQDFVNRLEQLGPDYTEKAERYRKELTLLRSQVKANSH